MKTITFVIQSSPAGRSDKATTPWKDEPFLDLTQAEAAVKLAEIRPANTTLVFRLVRRVTTVVDKPIKGV